MLRHPLLQRGEGVPPHTGLGVRVEVVQEVDSLAVGVTTDDDVLHAVVDAGQLEHGGFCGHTLDRDLGAGGKIFLRPGRRRTDLPVRNHVAGIPDDEHITNIGLREPGRQHPGVNTGHEDSRWSRVVSDSLELLDHVPLPVRPIFHYPMQDLADAERSLRRHLL